MFSIKLNQKLKTAIFLPLFLILLISVTSGCSIKLIADYDELIDRYATELQGKIETFLIKMERLAGTPEGTYSENTGFYDELQGTLNTLYLRAQTIDKNELVVEQIQLLLENVANLRKLHQKQGDSGLTKELIEPVKTAFNSQFKAIIKLQEALKRGKKDEK